MKVMMRLSRDVWSLALPGLANSVSVVPTQTGANRLGPTEIDQGSAKWPQKGRKACASYIYCSSRR